ncbi:class I SAM-dependent methyltransferase [Pseudomonas borbori]
MHDVSQLFGVRADGYAQFRPHYPEQLFAWLADQSPATGCALDIACGNGQASLPLSKHFTQVLACDSSFEQLRAAEAPAVMLFAANAEAQPLGDNSLDLIVVAQALHWFATPAFFREVARLLRPDGLFCAWCYGLMQVDPQVDQLITRFYSSTLAGCWPEGRSSIEAGYRDISTPFPRIEVPQMAIEAQWTFAHLLGYLRTWSAVQRWENLHGRDPVADLAPALREAWGDIKKPRFVHWPLHFLAGKPNPVVSLHQPRKEV